MSNPVTIDESKVNAVCMGQGLPVLLLHGLAASLHDWDPHLPALSAAGYRACALDLFGHGESAKPGMRDYHVEQALAHFAGWVDSLGLRQPAVLVGHSFGAYVALEHAIRHPGQVGGLVLTAPFVSVAQLPPMLRRAYLRTDVNAALIGRAPDWVLRLAIDISSLMMGRSGGSLHALPEPIRAQIALDYRRSAPGIYHMLGTMRDLAADLGRVTAPVLLIGGDHDQTLDPATFRQLAARLPNVAGTHYLHASHVVHQSHPGEVTALILEFLSKLS